MELPPIACGNCRGSGKLRTLVQRSWWLSWLPHTRKQQCPSCRGTGTTLRPTEEVNHLQSIADSIPPHDLLRFADAFRNAKKHLAKEWNSTVLNDKVFEALASDWEKWDNIDKWGWHVSKDFRQQLEAKYWVSSVDTALKKAESRKDWARRTVCDENCAPIKDLVTQVGADTVAVLLEETAKAIVRKQEAAKAEEERRHYARSANKVRAASLNLPSVQHSIATAVALGLLKTEVIGNGLRYVFLVLDSNTEHPLRINIPCGTIFSPQYKDTQKMVLLKDIILDLQPFDKRSDRLPAACSNMYRDVPSSDDTFEVGTFTEHPRLRQLLGSTAFQECNDWIVQQFAVWTITDNPFPGEMKAITEGPEADKRTHLCDSEMIAQIAQMFRKAKVPISEYQLFF